MHKGLDWADRMAVEHSKGMGCWCYKHKFHLCHYHEGMADGIAKAHRLRYLNDSIHPDPNAAPNA